MASHVGAAVIGELAGRVVSKVLTTLRDRSGVDEKLRQLNMLVIKLRSTVEVSEHLGTETASLLDWRDKLKEAADEGQQVLLSFQQRATPEADAATDPAKGHQGGSTSGAMSVTRNALQGMARGVRNAAALLLAGGQGAENLNSTVDRLEKVCKDVGKFIRLLQAEASTVKVVHRPNKRKGTTEVETELERTESGDLTKDILPVKSAHVSRQLEDVDDWEWEKVALGGIAHHFCEQEDDGDDGEDMNRKIAESSDDGTSEEPAKAPFGLNSPCSAPSDTSERTEPLPGAGEARMGSFAHFQANLSSRSRACFALQCTRQKERSGWEPNQTPPKTSTASGKRRCFAKRGHMVARAVTRHLPQTSSLCRPVGSAHGPALGPFLAPPLSTAVEVLALAEEDAPAKERARSTAAEKLEEASAAEEDGLPEESAMSAAVKSLNDAVAEITRAVEMADGRDFSDLECLTEWTDVLREAKLHGHAILGIVSDAKARKQAEEGHEEDLLCSAVESMGNLALDVGWFTSLVSLCTSRQ